MNNLKNVLQDTKLQRIENLAITMMAIVEEQNWVADLAAQMSQKNAVKEVNNASMERKETVETVNKTVETEVGVGGNKVDPVIPELEAYYEEKAMAQEEARIQQYEAEADLLNTKGEEKPRVMLIDGTKTFYPKEYLTKNPPEKTEDLWRGLIRRGELDILYGDTNIGKSIMSHQILCDILRNHPEETGLYFDIEMTDSQLMDRYFNENNGSFYNWPENMLYANCDVQEEKKDLTKNEILKELNSEDVYIDKPLKQTINRICVTLSQRPNLKYIVIDNLSALETEAEKASEAIKLISWLKKLKNLLKITVLLVAHTPKIDRTLPMDQNMLAGSKKIAALVDGMIAMNKVANSTSDTYLKHTKNRGKNSKEYNRETQVLRFTLEDQNGFPYFQYRGIEYESVLLPEGNVFKKADTVAKLKEAEAELNTVRRSLILHYSNEGLSTRKISEKLKEFGFLHNTGKDKIGLDLKEIGLQTAMSTSAPEEIQEPVSPFEDGNILNAPDYANPEAEPLQTEAEDDPFPPATTAPFFLFCPDRIKHLLRPTA